VVKYGLIKKIIRVRPLVYNTFLNREEFGYNKDTMSPDISSSSSSVTPVSRVLIIDDDEDITELIKDYLETEDIECKIINRGIDGLDEIRKKDGYYNVILLDLAMPEFSGLDVFNKLKEENLLKSNNVIIFTASSTQNGEIKDMMKRGAKYILRKPSSIAEILDVVTRFTIKKDEI
jgi:DNA-binding response OmpR family regulator